MVVHYNDVFLMYICFGNGSVDLARYFCFVSNVNQTISVVRLCSVL